MFFVFVLLCLQLVCLLSQIFTIHIVIPYVSFFLNFLKIVILHVKMNVNVSLLLVFVTVCVNDLFTFSYFYIIIFYMIIRPCHVSNSFILFTSWNV